jgi:hypothetical protein
MPKPRSGAPGTTDQLPKWEGPPENRPRGYLPAEDNPDTDRDAAGENLQDPDRRNLSDALATRNDDGSRDERIRSRAYQIWEEQGQQSGADVEHWAQAEREIEAAREASFLDRVKQNLQGDTKDDLEGPKAGARKAGAQNAGAQRAARPAKVPR